MMGPGLLNIFGLNGTATLLWAQHIGQNLHKKLKNIILSQEPRLVIAEFDATISDEVLPSSMKHITKNIKFNIRLDMPLKDQLKTHL